MEPLRELAKEKLKGRKVIAVMSAKGGVGKSVISALLSLSFPTNVTLIDLDIHTMAIAKLFGVEDKLLEVSKEGIEPVNINNVNLISLAGIVKNRYVILPGRNQSNVMKELIAYSNVKGNYIVFDLPPGLGDELLVLEELSEFTPLVITTPSKVSVKVVNYLLDYLKERGKKTIVVTNMSYFTCGNEKVKPFGSYEGDVSLPIDPKIEDYIGKIYEYEGEVKKVIKEKLIPLLTAK